MFSFLYGAKGKEVVDSDSEEEAERKQDELKEWKKKVIGDQPVQEGEKKKKKKKREREAAEEAEPEPVQKKEKKNKKKKAEEAAEEPVAEAEPEAAVEAEADKPAKKEKKEKKKKKKKAEAEEAAEEPEAKAEAEAEGVPGAEAEQAKPEQSKRKKALVKKQKKKAEALAAAIAAGEAAPAKKARWRDRHTAFLGQLPYNATAETIEHHFRMGGVQGRMEVRLLTDSTRKDRKEGNVGNSRGMAYLDLVAQEDLDAALALHHSEFDGRRINVEVAASGKSSTYSKDVLEKARLKAKEAKEELILAAIQEKIIDKGLSGDLVDDKAREFLFGVTVKVARESLTEFSELDFEGVENKSAYLMGLIKRHVKLSDSKELDEETRQMLEAQGGSSSKGGKGKSKGKGKGKGKGDGKGKGKGKSDGKGKGKGKGKW